jgi:DNA-binding response OmpR family regulator
MGEIMAKILVIEDDVGVLDGLVEILSLEDYEVLSARDGLQGVAIAQRWMPDLIICDIMMPNLDGYGVLEQVRANPQLSRIPFIFLTARGSRRDMRYGMDMGADDYLSKPFKTEELLKMIHARLELSGLRQQESARQIERLRWSVSHVLPLELRTPISNIMGQITFLLDDFDNLNRESIRELVLAIQRAGDRLHTVVEKYILYSRIEVLKSDPSRIRELRESRVELTDVLIRDAAEMQAYSFNRQGDLQVEIRDTPFLRIAEDDLMRIIKELVENALKYSDPGTLVRVDGMREGNMFILFVIDQGWGMTAEQMRPRGDLIQFDRSIYEEKGTGLGLTIAQGLVELYGGSLHIESQAQVGTQVRIHFPLAESTASVM